MGLQSLHGWTGDHVWAACEIVKPGAHHFWQHANKCQTSKISKDLNPQWNEMHHLDGFRPGDSLKFTVYDQMTGIGHDSMLGSREGTATIQTQDFYPNGFEGQLLLEGRADAVLEVRIVPLR